MSKKTKKKKKGSSPKKKCSAIKRVMKADKKSARGSRQVRISGLVSNLVEKHRKIVPGTKKKEYVDWTLRRLLKLPQAAA